MNERRDLVNLNEHMNVIQDPQVPGSSETVAYKVKEIPNQGGETHISAARQRCP